MLPCHNVADKQDSVLLISLRLPSIWLILMLPGLLNPCPQYSHGRTTLLAVQIDAAINSGNSGGPVLLEDKVVGIAFQCLTAGENIGYIIPVPVINHFLEDLDRHNGRWVQAEQQPLLTNHHMV